MGLVENLALAAALSTDAFSVAVVCGVQQFKNKDILRISLTIALFHILMPLTGFYGGELLRNILKNIFNFNSNIDLILNMVGAGLLMLIGFYMVIEQWLDTEDELCNFNLSGWGMMALSFTVSIDALSVGIGLSMLGTISYFSILLIGITAGVMMAAGLYFGSKLGVVLGSRAQILGGIGLIFLGLHFLDLF